jgi:hypothetical protein
MTVEFGVTNSGIVGSLCVVDDLNKQFIFIHPQLRRAMVEKIKENCTTDCPALKRGECDGLGGIKPIVVFDGWLIDNKEKMISSSDCVAMGKYSI